MRVIPTEIPEVLVIEPDGVQGRARAFSLSPTMPKGTRTRA